MKKLINRVRPGVLLALANFLRFVSAFIRLDLPTLLLPTKANSGNPNKRTESIGALAWVAGGFMLLGLALIISGIVLSIATNGSGGMIGGGASA